MQALINQLSDIIGKPINTPSLINEALTHRSFLNESAKNNLSSNERLEFLGDSILQFWVSNTIYLTFPDLDEGKLTAIRTHLVRTETLAILARQLSLGDYLQLSKGEEKDNGRHSQLLMANCFEALSAALYFSNGMKSTEKFFTYLFKPLISKVDNPDLLKDSKSLLQEKVQVNKKLPPKYAVIDSIGPDHKKTFTVSVSIDDQVISEGKGSSKQEAEEHAAKNALVKLGIKR